MRILMPIDGSTFSNAALSFPPHWRFSASHKRVSTAGCKS